MLNLIFVVLTFGTVIMHECTAADKEYPGILLLNEIMTKASNPLPYILRKAIRSCDDLSEDRKKEIVEVSSIMLNCKL